MTDTAKLKYFIERSGLTQTKLAELLGITVPTLNNKVLNKREFSVNEIAKIQKILNISLEEKEAIFFTTVGVKNNTI